MELIEEYRRALLFLRAGEPIEAARILAPIVAAEPSNAEARTQLALAYFASAQLGRAEAELRTLIDRDPSDHYTYHILGRTLERQNRPAEALRYLRIAAAMSPVPDYRKAADRVAARVGTPRSAR